MYQGLIIMKTLNSFCKSIGDFFHRKPVKVESQEDSVLKTAPSTLDNLDINSIIVAARDNWNTNDFIKILQSMAESGKINQVPVAIEFYIATGTSLGVPNCEEVKDELMDLIPDLIRGHYWPKQDWDDPEHLIKLFRSGKWVKKVQHFIKTGEGGPLSKITEDAARRAATSKLKSTQKTTRYY